MTRVVAGTVAIPWWRDLAPTGISASAWHVILPASMAEGDAQIIQAVLEGDVERYAELVDKYQGRAIRLAFSLLGNYEDARDASQEAFVSAYRALARFRGRAAFSTWLYRIVINACKDAHRRRSRQPMIAARVGEADPNAESDEALFMVDVADPSASPSDHLANQELSHTLSRSIQALPLTQRTAFLLHHVHGLPLDEVAGVMRCRVGTVKAHVFRATEHLRNALGPWLAENQMTVIPKS